MFISQCKRRCIRCIKSDTLCIKVDRLSTVIDLIGDGKRGVVVICRTDIPYVLRYFYHTLVKIFRVGAPNIRNKVQLPLVCVRHFQNGKHFCEVILHTGYVHLIQQDKVNVVVKAGCIYSLEHFGLVEVLGEFVKESEKLGPVTP